MTLFFTNGITLSLPIFTCGVILKLLGKLISIESTPVTLKEAPKTDPKKIEQLYRLLRLFHAFAKKHNFLYVIAGGTALGSLRCNGILPWDDDVDICVNQTQFAKIITSLKKEASSLNIQIIPFTAICKASAKFHSFQKSFKS